MSGSTRLELIERGFAIVYACQQALVAADHNLGLARSSGLVPQQALVGDNCTLYT
jgi:hypothetical protein